MTQTVVVGAGLAGCTTARYLAESGEHVTLIERHGVGAGASGRNGGWLVRRPDPWLDGLRRDAVTIYQELEADGLDCLLCELPLLLVALDDSELEHASAYAAGVGADALEPAGEPWLADDVSGAFLVPGCHGLDPMAATTAMAEAARREGVDMKLGDEVKRIVVERDRVVGVTTDRGSLAADRVVVAAGPLIAPLLAAVGVHLPTNAVRGWLLQTDPAGRQLPYVIEQALWPDQHSMASIARAPTLEDIADGEDGSSRLVSLLMGDRPGGSLVIGTSLNASTREDAEGAATVHEIAARALRIAPPLAGVRVATTWSGRRTMTPDGRPIVGPIPGIQGLAVAGGFSSVGMLSIPGLCRELGRDTPRDELDPGRFLSGA